MNSYNGWSRLDLPNHRSETRRTALYARDIANVIIFGGGRAKLGHPAEVDIDMMHDAFTAFAYGSNMLTARLRGRTPSATAVGIGQLQRHVLMWHKRGADGSAKCDVQITGATSDLVWGVLFRISRAQKPALDFAEGLGKGYGEKTATILTDRGETSAQLYCAIDKNPALQPYHWYKAFVVAGAREDGLPESWVAALELVRSIPDPDPERAVRHARTLSIGPGGDR